MLREFLDSVFDEIDSESLTDDEFATVTETVTEELNQASYDALKAVLQSREAVSGQLKKLNAYYVSQGVDVSGATYAANSQIFVGSEL